jgi:hypothetical protein
MWPGVLAVMILVGCDGSGETGQREVTAVRLGASGVLSTRSFTISEAEFQAMVQARRDHTRRPGQSFGPGVLAQAIEADCNSEDSTWVFSGTNLTGQQICLQYAPDEGPPMGTNEPYRTPWNIRSFWTAITAAAMFCDLRWGSVCEWYNNDTQLPKGERFCRDTIHWDFTGPDHPPNPIWVQAQPIGEGCEPN